MRPVFIYALLDPTAMETRYVGQTVGPDVRLRRHVRDAKKKKFYNANWIRSLLNAGLKPIMEILDVVPDNEADFWEREYIQNFRERGFKLTNGTDGGYGRSGMKWTPEQRAAISARLRGKKYSPEHCAAIGAAGRGRKHSPESCAAMSASRRGKKLTPEHCVAISAARRGKKHKPETIAKISAAKFGVKQSPETVAKKIAIISKRQRDEKGRLLCFPK